MDREISNLVTGDRIVFDSSPMMGEGDDLVFRCTLPPLANGAPLHVHDEMTESFAVISGALEIDLGNGRLQTLLPGDEIVLDAGTPHGFRNPLSTETVFMTTASPGLELERFLRSLYSLADAGRTNSDGSPSNPLAMASILSRMDMAVVGVPRPVQSILIGMLAGVARLAGVERKLSALVVAARTGDV